MRGITLTQPWATLVAIGAKRVETRSWATDYRGPIAIHAGMGLGPVGGGVGLLKLCRTEPFRSVLLAAGILGTPALPRGAIVAVAMLTECYRTNDSGGIEGFNPQPLASELAFGDYSPGRYAWLLSDVRPLATPIPYRGALSLWAVPGELEARLSV